MSDDVELRGITRRFGRQVAVDDISFEVPAGSFFSLLGPSGCGKSTTLRMISGFDSPDEGVLRIGGQDMRGIPPERRPTNMVFQRWALFPHMTVAANVAFGLEMRRLKRPDIRRQVQDALALVGLVEKAGQKPGELSGGQMQRVALARALVMRPKVLLLDEPLGALDLKLRAQLQVELKRIQREVGATFIYVTHDQGEAMVMSDRIAVMRAGRIEQIGAPREIYDAPASTFVAGFIGNTNLLDVAVESIDSGMVSVRAGGFAFAATAADGSRATAGKVSVRYERIRVGRAAAGLGVAARATIRDAIFVGSALHYTLTVHDGPQLTAEVPHDGLHEILSIGADVPIGWEPSGAVFFADA
jgi:spermidine/putrescine transport system ATP-binding protein